MEPQNHFDPREELHVRDDWPRRAATHKRPWHRQSWVWMIVVLIGLCVFVVAIGSLTDQVAQVNNAIREQTTELSRQNGILASLGQGLRRLELTFEHGIDRIVTVIENLTR